MTANISIKDPLEITSDARSEKLAKCRVDRWKGGRAGYDASPQRPTRKVLASCLFLCTMEKGKLVWTPAELHFQATIF